MISWIAERLTPLRAGIGEGPSWDDRTSTLTVVDIPAGTLHRVDAGGTPVRPPVVLDRMLGAAVPTGDPGRCLLVTRDGFSVLEADDSVRPVLSVLGDRADVRFNDAKCDPAGRLFAGTLSFAEAPADGTLYRLDDGPVASTVLNGIGLCNGLGWSPGGRRMYFVDTRSGAVDRFTYDVGTSTPMERRRWVQLEPGTPDGLCVDDEGCVWIALWGGGRVQRYTPDGELMGTVMLPVDQVTSCAFGGPDRDILFITTARAGLDPDQLAAQPHAGDLFALRPGTTGPPATPWRFVRGSDVAGG